MIALVKDKHQPSHQIATVWHLQAAGEVIDTAHGNVRVLVGESAYQLATGEKVKL